MSSLQQRMSSCEGSHRQICLLNTAGQRETAAAFRTWKFNKTHASTAGLAGVRQLIDSIKQEVQLVAHGYAKKLSTCV